MGFSKEEMSAGRRKVFHSLGKLDPFGKEGSGFQIVKSQVLRQNGAFFVRREFQARSFSR